jgi:WD40 repeat protein
VQINDIEPEEGYEVEIEMLTEVKVPGGARIKSLTTAGQNWFLLDESGSLQHIKVPEISLDCMEFSKLWSFHSGKICHLFVDDASHSAVSADSSGNIWAYDLLSRTSFTTRKFPQGITCLIRAHRSQDTNQSVFFLGHDEGFLRQVVRCSDGFHLSACVRPHKEAVAAVCISPIGSLLASCGHDRTLFFFTVEDNVLEPLAFCSIPLAPITAIWTMEGVIIGCEDGTLLCVTPPDSHDHTTHATYEYTAVILQREFTLPKELWPAPPKPDKGVDEDGEAEDDGAALASRRAQFHDDLHAALLVLA